MDVEELGGRCSPGTHRVVELFASQQRQLQETRQELEQARERSGANTSLLDPQNEDDRTFADRLLAIYRQAGRDEQRIRADTAELRRPA